MTPRTPPTSIEEQLRLDEGDISYVYQDSLGFWTIGVGFMVDRRRGGRLPDAVRDFWLGYVLEQRRAALLAAFPWFAGLDPVRQGVLLNMAYQMDVVGLMAFKDVINDVAAGNYATAASAMLASLWAKQTPDRAGRLAQQMRSGQWV